MHKNIPFLKSNNEILMIRLSFRIYIKEDFAEVKNKRKNLNERMKRIRLYCAW